MKSQRNHRLLHCLLAATLLILGGSVHASEWLENVTVLVKVDGEPSGTAHVYDSEDYQRMLLTIDERPVGAVIDLAATIVSAIPADSIRHLDNGCLGTGNTAGEFLATLDNNEGILVFLWDDTSVSIEPIPPMIGPVDLERVLALKPTYKKAAEAYNPDTNAVAVLKGVKVETEIRVYFGTWCHICKKLIPPFIGTIDRVGNPNLVVEYFGVDEDLTEPPDEIDKHAVRATPTVIVLRNGREIGRIEEEASGTVESDLLEILAE